MNKKQQNSINNIFNKMASNANDIPSNNSKHPTGES